MVDKSVNIPNGGLLAEGSGTLFILKCPCKGHVLGMWDQCPQLYALSLYMLVISVPDPYRPECPEVADFVVFFASYIAVSLSKRLNTVTMVGIMNMLQLKKQSL